MSNWPEWKIKAHNRAIMSVLALGMVIGAGVAVGIMILITEVIK